MKIGIITEMNVLGQVSKDYTNMRTEFVWAWMLDADFIPYTYFEDPSKYLDIMDNYDFLLFIPSKSKPEYLIHIKNCPIPHGIMQEGGRYQWLEWNTKYQELYLDILKTVNVVLVHNDNCDKQYFKSLTHQPVEVLQTYQFIDKYKHLINNNKKENVFIGGNRTGWYMGTHSYLAIKDLKWNKIGFPMMGRRHDDEREITEIKDCRVLYHDYTNLNDFMITLSEYKYGIHMMSISAAGSFYLNCGILGILCIGNYEDDTASKLFPYLQVHPQCPTAITQAKQMMVKLKNDKVFFDKCMKHLQENLYMFDAERQKDNLKQQFKRYINVN